MTTKLRISSSSDSGSDNEPIIHSKKHKRTKNKKLAAHCPFYKISLSEILCSKLNEQQVEIWLKFTEKFGKRAVVTSHWRPNVTDLVTLCSLIGDEQNSRSQTSKYFQCIMSGAFIVCLKWIQCVCSKTVFLT